VIDQDFTISGKKIIIVKKIEKDFFMLFDPINLNYFNINGVGADILYYISKKFSLEKIIKALTDEYAVSDSECKKLVIEFIDTLPVQSLIYPNLITSNIYLELAPFK
jgi:hypothetical protein